MNKLFIFGLSSLSQAIGLEVLEDESTFELAAFVSEDSAAGQTLLGRPIIGLNQLLSAVDPKQCSAIVGGSSNFLNQDRLSDYMKVKLLGFKIASIVSRQAKVAANVKIKENSFIGPGSQIFDRAQVGIGTVLIERSVIGTGAKAENFCWIAGESTLSENSVVGKNSVLLRQTILTAGAQLAPWTFIGEPTFIDKKHKSPIFRDTLFPSGAIYYFGDSK